MKIAMGSDHAGHKLKVEVEKVLHDMNIEIEDYGCNCEESVDYPDYAQPVAERVAAGEVDKGILICGTGIGISISANKVNGIRAAVCHDVFSAKASRAHNNSNILAMGERVVGPGLAGEIVKAWLDTEFEGGRHADRVDKMMAMEEK
ncbi:ribose 5-phosphate isomerase B [Salibacterium halotolerans]|uniref:Ribose 5-phosphate isomerase B n=1 Tax=Salibacterium halotolerans TaxID=1884432 RepID=A0A1I5V2M0_9BACI|nr:ribose 5-phosphate isomerase B [Salibacterium halotolerans]SFQ01763.1 ribose 5-phosphate isomerase B [Salibacterium halotolerans]